MRFHDWLARVLPHPAADKVEARTIRAVQTAIAAVCIACIVLVLQNLLLGHWVSLAISGLVAAISAAGIWLVRHGKSSFGIRITLWGYLVCTLGDILASPHGIHDVAVTALPGLIICSALIASVRFHVVYTVAVLLAVTAVVCLEWLGHRPYPIPSSATALLDILMILLLCAVGSGLLMRNFQAALLALRRANDEVTLSRNNFQSMIDLAVDAIIVAASDGRILDVNRQAMALTGCAREELIGLPLVSLLDQASPEEAAKLAGARANAVVAVSGAVRRRDGARVPVEVRATRLPNAQIQSIWRDDSEHVRIEEVRRKSAEQFAKAFHSNPAAIAITDLEQGRLFDVNHTFEKVTGYDRSELLGRTALEIGLWENPQDRAEAIGQLTAEGRVRNKEWRFRRKSGEVFQALFSAETIEIEGRAYSISSTVDITERLQLEERLRRSQKLESLGRLAGGVAHDFNNLLTLINGYSALLLEELEPGNRLRAYAEDIRQAGERAAGLTRQLLAFSRRGIAEPRPINLAAFVRNAERMVRLLIRADVSLTLRLDDGSGFVMADPDQVHQVIVNLVANARDAMPNGGHLTISVSRSAREAPGAPHAGDWLALAVTDTGIGMDAAIRQHIFEPFFTTKEAGKGTGLGLSTVYGIVEQGSGWIDVRSEAGKGSCFTVYLPRVHAGEASEPEPGVAPPLRGDETILLVEDQEAVRKFARTVLQAHGYRVLEAGSGEEGLLIEFQFTDPIHLLLTDAVLPGINGKALWQGIRKRRPNLKSLMMSGYSADVVSRAEAIEDGMAYLAKPFSPQQLVAKVRDVLGHR
jgi:PAS domain S-box-containing protein